MYLIKMLFAYGTNLLHDQLGVNFSFDHIQYVFFENSFVLLILVLLINCIYSSMPVQNENGLIVIFSSKPIFVSLLMI